MAVSKNSLSEVATYATSMTVSLLDVRSLLRCIGLQTARFVMTQDTNMRNAVKLPEQLQNTRINVTVSIDHDSPMTDDDLMIDPVSDIALAIKKTISSYKNVRGVDVRVGGDLSKFTADFAASTYKKGA